MLLRASRNSAQLTKRAEEKTALLGAGRLAKAVGRRVAGAGRSVVRGVKDPLGSVGKFVWSHPKGSLAAAAGVSAAGMGVSEGMQRGARGMDPPYPQVKAPRMYSF